MWFVTHMLPGETGKGVQKQDRTRRPQKDACLAGSTEGSIIQVPWGTRTCNVCLGARAEELGFLSYSLSHQSLLLGCPRVVSRPQSLQLFGQILAVQEQIVLEVASGPFCWQ